MNEEYKNLFFEILIYLNLLNDQEALKEILKKIILKKILLENVFV